MPDKPKSPAAQEMGRKRMAKLTPAQRKALASKAARTRWPVPPAKSET